MWHLWKCSPTWIYSFKGIYSICAQLHIHDTCLLYKQIIPHWSVASLEWVQSVTALTEQTPQLVKQELDDEQLSPKLFNHTFWFKLPFLIYIQRVYTEYTVILVGNLHWEVINIIQVIVSKLFTCRSSLSNRELVTTYCTPFTITVYLN